MNLIKSLTISFIILIFCNLYLRIESNNYEQQLSNESENVKSLDQFLSSYYLMRISLIYYSSNDTSQELKERSKRLVFNELSNQEIFINKLKKLNQKNDPLFNKMLSDHAVVKQLAESITLSTNKKEITNIAFNIIPEKRNAFRISTEEYYNNANKKIETFKTKYHKYKSLEQIIFILLTFNCFAFIFYKKIN